MTVYAAQKYVLLQCESRADTLTSCTYQASWHRSSGATWRRAAVRQRCNYLCQPLPVRLGCNQFRQVFPARHRPSGATWGRAAFRPSCNSSDRRSQPGAALVFATDVVQPSVKAEGIFSQSPLFWSNMASCSNQSRLQLFLPNTCRQAQFLEQHGVVIDSPPRLQLFLPNSFSVRHRCSRT